ncbi:hypothetical protein VNO78_08279 [Psophocarpus tetragonolobus]|uniref:Uncharacterized protein n=1 Tax=Psophocarpus tetragonolobus TaxID=3891 RepID=A0AAN9SVS6_PSOTE
MFSRKGRYVFGETTWTFRIFIEKIMPVHLVCVPGCGKMSSAKCPYFCTNLQPTATLTDMVGIEAIVEVVQGVASTSKEVEAVPDGDHSWVDLEVLDYPSNFWRSSHMEWILESINLLVKGTVKLLSEEKTELGTQLELARKA